GVVAVDDGVEVEIAVTGEDALALISAAVEVGVGQQAGGDLATVGNAVAVAVIDGSGGDLADVEDGVLVAVAGRDRVLNLDRDVGVRFAGVVDLIVRGHVDGGVPAADDGIPRAGGNGQHVRIQQRAWLGVESKGIADGGSIDVHRDEFEGGV